MKYLVPILLIIVFSLHCTNIAAQDRQERHERIKAMKIAFITDRLELTADEAEKFWPIYNDYERRKFEVGHELRKLHRYYAENQDNIEEQEQIELLDKYIKLQKQDSELLTSYHEKFIEILPPEKVMKLYIAEVEFRNHLIKQLREHKGEGRGKGGRGGPVQ